MSISGYAIDVSFVEHRQRRVVCVGAIRNVHDIAPADDRQDQHVDQRGAIVRRVALSNKQDQPGDQERARREVETVGNRRERERLTEETRVVVRQHVADDEGDEAGRDQRPGETRHPMDPDGGDDRDDAGEADRLKTGPEWTAVPFRNR